jgi:hypothetical protein
VGTVTGYGLDGPGIELRGRDFPPVPWPVLEPPQPPVQWILDLFPGCKAGRMWFDHSPQFSAEVKERVDLHLFSPFGPPWPILE